MKNRILTVCACLITCVILSACGAKNSGLYRISVGEETGTQTDAGEAGQTGMTAAVDVGQTGMTDVDGEDRIGSTGDTATDTDVSEDEPVTVYVHVCGAVINPGVYELGPEDRVFTAVEAAGGFTEEASQDYVNLAERVADGMKITIPTVEELAAIEADSGTGTGTAVFAAIEYPGGSGSLININTADEKLLTSITGIGETRAKAIIAYREEHGPFAQTDDIKNVSGIGESTYNKLKDEITVK
ncbi:competence protein ComEA [Lachnospiraceae bacterium XBB2008]|nr:competence protein ComEA [Lachnospiraceae bacterium XBB2008]